ncbi:MAG: cytochrome c-550 PedF [Rhodobacteraceae bacterium]|nr:cytochrome c-550 PedF [Paracoccaceae bacterium]
MNRFVLATVTAVGACALYTGIAFSHGDVNPQPVDASDLPSLDGWKEENPYREMGGDVYETAMRIGERGYQANCAACHGLGGVSGGIAPDLRLLEPGYDDPYYIEKVRGGARGMPAFDGVLDQEAIWAVKSWLDSLHDEAMEERYGSN